MILLLKFYTIPGSNSLPVAQDNPWGKKVSVKGIGDAGVVNNGKLSLPATLHIHRMLTAPLPSPPKWNGMAAWTERGKIV